MMLYRGRTQKVASQQCAKAALVEVPGTPQFLRQQQYPLPHVCACLDMVCQKMASVGSARPTLTQTEAPNSSVGPALLGVPPQLGPQTWRIV